MTKVVLPSLLLGSLLAFSAQAGTEEAAMPMPCIGPVCVGAELQSMLELPWLEVKPPAGDAGRTRGQRRMAGALRGQPRDMATVLAYWPQRWFNGPALRALSSLHAVCEDMGYSWRPRAMLKGPGGSRLTVAFEPVPSLSARQHFRVATVSVRFPKNADAAQIERARDEIRGRYAAYPTYPTNDLPAVLWRLDASGQASARLFAPLRVAEQSVAALREQPSCRAQPVDSPVSSASVDAGPET
ncbi:hypothetical protein [uncultured Azohydromonas sp.]|jgi:hypothetical protein|uniref:hypothetical protein n=1 Tax=uncultured Azohydromonas sp. TaxID=487342 RepID=UPI0026167A34|nr:hypothetical protein [uncultured Azohydromonas sp.]